MAHPDLPDEQRYFDTLYARLDHEIARAERRLDGVRFDAVGGLHQSRFEREAFAGHLEDRVATLKAHRRDDLCFGRIDLDDGRRFYIGRMGLSDESHEPLLIDWRAPAAAPFYQATPRTPLGVVRRRHFLTRRRTILDLEDEVLDAARLSGEDAGSLRGEAALQYAMNTARTGRMREIAATIQREQDEIIRAPLSPAVFVQGGPGTGKTAVALHRAAFLLYTHRRQVPARDLLVVGPNPLFLRYIEHVLPSLGETGVELTSLPQVYARREWDASADETRLLEADPVMIEVIHRAIDTRERPLARPIELEIEGERVVVRPSDTRSVVTDASHRQGRHNPKAAYVHDRLLRLVWRRGRQAFREIVEFEDFRAEMLTDRRFRRLSQRVWPVLSPEELLNDLFGFPALLAEATRGLLDDRARAALARPWSRDARRAGWTTADAPLLDEAAHQLGPIPVDLDPAQKPRIDVDPWVDEEAIAVAEYRRERLGGLGGGIVSREALEERVAGRARGADAAIDEGDVEGRVWRYAVIDEAQDVSPMEWRMIGRHLPRRLATVVGDLAQGTETWSPPSWSAVREGLGAPDDARLAELTINYRTPTEISAFAARVLAVIDPDLRPPEAIRSVPGSFAAESSSPSEVVPRAVGASLRLHDEVGEGVACLIAPPSRLADVHRELEQRLGRDVPHPRDPTVIDAPVMAIAPDLAKGLEFDVVVLVDPDAVVDEAGWRALYVSATRATQRLLVVHTGASPLPRASS